ncbi:MAG: MOSC domain-containing protein [Acidobacteriaceae bacterium]|nr:MOSC domain-containing protein [Acidobacteriaceae bacterium]
MRGRVIQINISRGGLPKTPVACAEIGPLGILGDEHRHKSHGGPDKALLLIAGEFVDALCAEGWPVFYGALGENLTTRGLDHRAWRPGQRFRTGTVLFELTTPRGPCANLNVYGEGIQKRIHDQRVRDLDPASLHWGESGFYARILEPGIVFPNDIIEAIEGVDPVV